MSTWIILASGPSMTLADANAVRGRGTVVAINNTVQLAPWADILYSCDPSWWRQCPKLWRDFKGRRVGLANDNHLPEIEQVPKEGATGLGRKGVATGHNSGHQAINLAFLEGARTIVLLGFDMQHTYGMRHWHGDHAKGLGNFGCVDLCQRAFPPLADALKAEGVRVINASRETALRCFERMPLKDALALM
jgi:hypothetical protein